MADSGKKRKASTASVGGFKALGLSDDVYRGISRMGFKVRRERFKEQLSSVGSSLTRIVVVVEPNPGPTQSSACYSHWKGFRCHGSNWIWKDLCFPVAPP